VSDSENKGGLVKGASPRGFTRALMRFPIWFYRLGLGGLFGERMLLLNHVGRTSGQPRQAMLEVVRHDREQKAYLVVSGWGERSHWFRNVMAQPEVTIVVGGQRRAVRAERLSQERAVAELHEYARRYPKIYAALMKRFFGETAAPDGAEAEQLAEKAPLVAFKYG
jgi:deazaflavin-dependent oxidoreductase (nitroreductase family)